MFEGMDRETLGVDADEVWEFCMKCSQPTSLSLILFPNNRDGSESQMLTVLDDTERKADLKRLDLQVEEFQIDWPSMKKLMRKGLEEISLVQPEDSNNGIGFLPFSSSDVYGILKDYGSTLESIKLEGVGLEEKEISFPNLATLSIIESTFSTFKFFTDSVTPNLEHLFLEKCFDSYRKGSSHPDPQLAFDCLHSLSKKNQKNLISLSAIRVLKSNQEFTSGGLLTFIQLESLDLKRTTEKIQKWFSTNEYPNLIHLLVHNDDLKPEFFKKGSKSLHNDGKDLETKEVLRIIQILISSLKTKKTKKRSGRDLSI